MASYNNFNDNYAGIINAIGEVRRDAGEKARYYPPNYQGIIDAIRDMSKDWSGALPDQFPPGWIPIYDDDGNVIGGNWEPGYEPAQGALWFDERQGRLMVYVDDAYYQANGADVLTKVQETQPAADVPGALWYQPSEDNLYLWDGNVWILVSSQTVNTASLPLANPTTVAAGARALPSTDNLTTQSDLNTWIVDALEALDENPGGNAEVYVSATPPSDAEEGDLWFSTVSLELLVRYETFWVPSSIPLTSDPNFVSLATTVNVVKSGLEGQITSAVNRISHLEEEPHHAYTLEPDYAASGIKLVDEGGDSNSISFKGKGGIIVNISDQGITYDTSALTNKLNAVQSDYTPKADHAILSASNSQISSRVAALESVNHVNLNDYNQLVVDVSVLPSQALVDSKLPLMGGNLTGPLDMGNNRISGLTAALHPNDAVRNAEFAAYKAQAAADYMPKNSNVFSSLDVQRDDISVAALKVTGGAAAGRRAIELNTNRATGANAIFGQTTHAGEVAWEFNGNENFSWIDGTNGKQLRIDKDGVVAKNLTIGVMQRNGNGDELIMNKIDVKERLEAYQTAFTGLRSALNSSSDFDEFKQSALIALAGL